jgi:predicted SAM-dependent methyltransferase
MKLHLGCGNNYLPGYTNVDIDSDLCDLKADLEKLNFEDNSVDEIYCCHVLEHFKRNKVIDVLYSWIKCLKIGGEIRICVPDFDKVVKYYIDNNRSLKNLIGFLNGGQKNNYDIHFMNYNFDLLNEILTVLGCDNIQRYDTEKFLKNHDDYSKAYLPHMDKNGTLMSLNIVAIKKYNVDFKTVSDYTNSNNIFKNKN